MSGIDNPIIFYPASFLLILFSILSIGFNNIFKSLLFAIGVFFLVGFLFYILGSEYNAIIQIAVYGIAVPVVLGIAIMFTNTKALDFKKEASNLNYVLILTIGLFILAIVYLVLTSLTVTPNGFNFSEELGTNSLQLISAFGNGIFVRYVWAFEILSIILTMVVVGLTLFKGEKCKK